MDLLRMFKPKKPLNFNGFSGHPLPWMDRCFDGDQADYRGAPTYVCPCGYDLFVMAARFDETQLPAMYLLDGVCAHCGALVTLPCPADEPDLLAVND